MAPGRQARVPGFLFPIALGLALVLPALVWLGLDHSIWPWDPTVYGEASIDLWATLRATPGDWGHVLIHVMPQKAPGIAWLGQFFVPLHRIFGSYEAAMLLSVVACEAASITLVYLAARRLGSKPMAALAGVLVLASAPLFIVMARNFFVEPLQMLAVAWVLFVMASAREWRPALTIAQLAGAISLGLLAKISSPIYMAAPAAVALAFAWLEYQRHAERPAFQGDRTLLASVFLASPLVLGAAAWYGHNAHRAIDRANEAAGSTRFGKNAGFGTKFHVWVHRLDQATFLQYVDIAMLLILGTALVLLIRREGLDLRGRVHTVAPYAACVIALLVVLAGFATNTNDEIRYLLPLIPFLALLIAGLISSVNSRIIGVAALGVLAVQFVLVNLPTTTFNSTSYRYLALRGPERSAQLHDELSAVARLSCAPATAGQTSIVGVHTAWLNARIVELLAHEAYAGSGRRCRYASLGANSLGSAEKSPARAWNSVRTINPPFYISVDYGNPRNPLPRRLQRKDTMPPFKSASAIVFRRLLKSGRMRIVPGSRSGGFVVLQRAR